MQITVAGASGFLGLHLVRALRNAGHRVTVLVRRSPRPAAAEIAWDPETGALPRQALRGADVAINLCGAGVADRRWTRRRREVLRTSRIGPTALLAAACAEQGTPTLINASAVGIYGDRGQDPVTEATPAGAGFLARLCVDWEAAANPAAEAGTRVVLLRTGLVLGTDGGMYPLLARLTRLMAGGRLGSGTQWWPWISVVDHIAATVFLCDAAISGPVNVTAPHPVTNAAFTAELGHQLHRPTPWAVPPVALRAALGGFADEVLGGQRALPAVLDRAGFRFTYPDLPRALAALT